MNVQTVGVVGCGQMGSGIVEICAKAGYDVVVREPTDELLQQGLGRIQKSLGKAASKGKLSRADADAAWSHIRGTTALEDFSACDLVIEAVPEDMALKKEIFAALDRICPPHTIIGSNTSCLCVTEMASATERGDRVLGLHFFNPATVMQLLEIIRTILTSDDTLEACRAFGESVGKTVIVAKDMPGFIVSRLLIPYILNAIRALEGGLATREDIDSGMVLGCNHPMGPLLLADFIGLDTILHISEQMFGELKDPALATPPLLRRMVLAGQLGYKTGQGFYEHS